MTFENTVSVVVKIQVQESCSKRKSKPWRYWFLHLYPSIRRPEEAQTNQQPHRNLAHLKAKATASQMSPSSAAGDIYVMALHSVKQNVQVLPPSDQDLRFAIVLKFKQVALQKNRKKMQIVHVMCYGRRLEIGHVCDNWKTRTSKKKPVS